MAGTGPRRLPASQAKWVDEQLMRVLGRLQDEYGVKWIVSGMALEFDQRWAELAIVCGLQLHAMVPFPAQPDPWPEQAQARWQEILDLAAEITVVSRRNPSTPRMAAAMLHQRNDAMLKASQAVVACWDATKTKGGTWSAVNKAVQLRRPIIWIDPRAQTVKIPTHVAWARILSTSTD